MEGLEKLVVMEKLIMDLEEVEVGQASRKLSFLRMILQDLTYFRMEIQYQISPFKNFSDSHLWDPQSCAIGHE